MGRRNADHIGIKFAQGRCRGVGVVRCQILGFPLTCIVILQHTYSTM